LPKLIGTVVEALMREVLSLITSGLSEYIAHLRQECHDSKFGIFELLVQKETFADALLTGVVS
jgi:hypothetical protein